MSEYVNAHRRMGAAKEHKCSCGKQAVDWAYQYPAGVEPLQNERGTLYSNDPSHYAPMCRECHIAFDRSRDPRMEEIVRARAKACGEGVKRRLAKPGGAEVFSIAGKKAAAKRRKCSVCEIVRSPGVIAVHQKRSGHEGYEDLL